MKKLLLFFAAMCCMMVANAQQFTDANGIKYNVTSTEDKTVEVIANNYSGAVVIPATVTYNKMTFSVTGIGKCAFLNNRDLISVTLPDGLKSIGEQGFDDCRNMLSINIPSSVTEIGNYAFLYCESLTSITLPEGLESIGVKAFLNCYKLASITIPSSLTSIGAEAFNNSSLSSISVDEGNPIYDSRDNCNAIIETATNTLVAGCKNTVIPLSVTAIGDYAFSRCESLTSITLPDGLKSIGVRAFYGCYKMTSINLPSSLESIGDEAFEFCEELISIIIPEKVTSIGYATFYYCNKLISVTLPNGLESIGKYAFYDCISLTSITLPDGLKSIGDNAFDYCYKLASITIPSSLTSIGAEAFNDCMSLSSISIDEGNTVYDSRDNCNAIIETATNTLIAGCNKTVIPLSVTAIGALAFYGFSNLTSITIPNSVTTIGNKAFKECTGMESITVLASTPPTLGEEVFYDVTTTIPVYVPDVDAYSNESWGGFTNFQAMNIDDYKQAAIAEINAAKEGVSLSEEDVTAINGYINTIKGVTTISDENLAAIETAKKDALAVISQAIIRIAREAALAAIEAAMQGETSDYLTGLAQQYINIINAATDVTTINNARNTALVALNAAVEAYKAGKGDAFGSLGEKQNGPAIEVIKDGERIILYRPDRVNFIKANN